MKAWHVTLSYDSWVADVVRAETAGKAKVKSWMYAEGDSEFIDLRARREPKLDGDETLTARLIHDAGYLVPCTACGDYCAENWDDEPVVFRGADAYHQSCLPDQREPTR